MKAAVDTVLNKMKPSSDDVKKFKKERATERAPGCMTLNRSFRSFWLNSEYDFDNPLTDKVFRAMREIALEVSACQASSAEIERGFSIAGMINKRQKRIAPTTMHMRLMIKLNPQHVLHPSEVTPITRRNGARVKQSTGAPSEAQLAMISKEEAALKMESKRMKDAQKQQTLMTMIREAEDAESTDDESGDELENVPLEDALEDALEDVAEDSDSALENEDGAKEEPVRDEGGGIFAPDQDGGRGQRKKKLNSFLRGYQVSLQ